MKRSTNPAPSSVLRGSESLEREQREAIRTAIDYMLKAAVLMGAIPRKHPTEAIEELLMSDMAYNAARREINRAWENVKKSVTNQQAFRTVLELESCWCEREITATTIGWRLGVFGSAGVRAGDNKEER